MANGFPGFGKVASIAARGAGLSLSPGQQAALLSGARSSALLLRGVGFVGSALLAAYLLSRLMRAQQPPGPWQYPAGWDVCGAITGVVSGAPRTCLNLGEVIYSLPPPPLSNQRGFFDNIRETQFPDLWRADQVGFAKRVSGSAPWQQSRTPGLPALLAWGPTRTAGVGSDGRRLPWASAFPFPAEMTTGADAGYAAPGTGSRGGVIAPIPGWPGLWPEGVTRPVDVPVPVAGAVPGAGGAVRPGEVVTSPPAVIPVFPGIGTGVEIVGGEIITSPVVNATSQTLPQWPLKEMKARASMMMAGFKMFYNSATEAGDFVDALHDALPKCRQAKTQAMYSQQAAARKHGWNKKYKKAQASPAAKLRAVTQFLADVYADPSMPASAVCSGYGRNATAQKWAKQERNGLDRALDVYVDKALKNLVVENAKDFVYGKIGQQIGKISRDTGLPVGLQTIKSASQFSL